VAEDFAVIRPFHVERDAALVAVVGLEVRRILPAQIHAVRITVGALDLDHIGAEIGEHHPGARTGDEGALLNDADALECRLHGCVSALGLVARLEPSRRLAVIVDRLRGGVRHHEPDGALLFLDQMRDQARGAREQRHTLEAGERIAGV